VVSNITHNVLVNLPTTSPWPTLPFMFPVTFALTFPLFLFSLLPSSRSSQKKKKKKIGTTNQLFSLFFPFLSSQSNHVVVLQNLLSYLAVHKGPVR